MASILTVSELTRAIREVLEGRIGEVWVEGEISNYRKQSSGHHYFTLKDDRAQLACVMFARSYGAQTRIPLSDGMQVQVFGQVTVYEARGQYQLIVQLVQSKGQGLLQAKFEALKRKLQAEGLFDPDHKRPLPQFPRRVALVTSATGAAVQDMLNILLRRSPWLSILICPVRVQGEGAAVEISNMIDYVSSRAVELKVDVMIIGRGGGSLEDLWEFNEEIVARSIYRSRIPVISAVGHEIDFTITDFVADRRAPTPSAAAEIVAPDILALQGELISRRSRPGSAHSPSTGDSADPIATARRHAVSSRSAPAHRRTPATGRPFGDASCANWKERFPATPIPDRKNIGISFGVSFGSFVAGEARRTSRFENAPDADCNVQSRVSKESSYGAGQPRPVARAAANAGARVFNYARREWAHYSVNRDPGGGRQDSNEAGRRRREVGGGGEREAKAFGLR